MNCPLCKSTELVHLENLSSKSISYAYQRKYSIDVSHLFNSDEIQFQECKHCLLRFYYPLISGDEKFYSQLSKATGGYYLHEKPEYHSSLVYLVLFFLLLDHHRMAF